MKRVKERGNGRRDNHGKGGETAEMERAGEKKEKKYSESKLDRPLT